MIYWKFPHILSMFAAATLLVGTELVVHRVVRTRDVPSIRRIAKAYKPLGDADVAIVTSVSSSAS